MDYDMNAKLGGAQVSRAAQTQRPFAETDARHSAKYGPQPVMGPLTIPIAVDRIHAITQSIHLRIASISEQLEDHADRLHGTTPCLGREEPMTPDYGVGHMASLFGAIEVAEILLGTITDRLSRAAERNTNIA